MQEEQGIGFVGLGPMGQPMALNLLKATANQGAIRVFDPQEELAAPLVALDASQVSCLADVATPGSLAFTMLPDDPSLLRVTLGEGGLLYQLRSGGVHLSLATNFPEVATQLAKLYARRGSTFLTATVLGDPDMALRGELPLFLSGEATAKKRVRPFLAALTRHISDLGEQVETAALVRIQAMREAAVLMEGDGFEHAHLLCMLVGSPLLQGNGLEGKRLSEPAKGRRR